MFDFLLQENEKDTQSHSTVGVVERPAIEGLKTRSNKRFSDVPTKRSYNVAPKTVVQMSVSNAKEVFSQSTSIASAKSVTRARFQQRPPLPHDTDVREENFYKFPEARNRIPTAVAPFHGRDTTNLAPARDSFPWRGAERAPEAVLDHRRHPWEDDRAGRRSFYGNYVGPKNEFGGAGRPPPMTPVDRAAYYHDMEYGDIYSRYGYSEFEYGLSFTRELDGIFGSSLSENEMAVQAFGWLGQTSSLDPAMQLELAWADVKIIGRSWLYTGEGIFGGFYRGDEGEKALIGDLAWATAITGFHVALVAWRLAVMVPLGITYQVLKGLAGMVTKIGEAIGGDVGKAISWIGGVSSRIVVGVGQVVQGLATLASTGFTFVAGLASGIAGGLVYIGGSIVRGALKEVGKHVKKAAKWIKKRTGCFITTACLRARGAKEHELDEFRAFRDGWLSNTPDGRTLIELYYKIAPSIVEKIEQSVMRGILWNHIYQRWVSKVLTAIRLGNRGSALSLYGDMIRALAALATSSKHSASLNSIKAT